MASWQELKWFGCLAQTVSKNRVEGFSNGVQQRNGAVWGCGSQVYWAFEEKWWWNLENGEGNILG